MYFAVVCAIHVSWLALAGFSLYTGTPSGPLAYFLAVLTATIYALPISYKISSEE